MYSIKFMGNEQGNEKLNGFLLSEYIAPYARCFSLNDEEYKDEIDVSERDYEEYILGYEFDSDGRKPGHSPVRNFEYMDFRDEMYREYFDYENRGRPSESEYGLGEAYKFVGLDSGEQVICSGYETLAFEVVIMWQYIVEQQRKT